MEKLLLDGKWELHYAPEQPRKTTAQAVKEDPAYTHIEANVPGNAELDLYLSLIHILRPTGYGQNLALMMLVELLVWDAQGLL